MVSNLKLINMTEFSGGLVSNRPPSNLKLNEASDLDNVVISSTGFIKRNGDKEFNSTAMYDSTDILGISYYKNTSGNDYLLAISGNKIYKSDNLDGTMDDITGTLIIGSSRNYLWQNIVYNDLNIWVGGMPDAPFKWNGTGDAALLTGSPPSGSFIFQMRDRVFIGGTNANPSTIYWSVLANPEDWTGVGSGNNVAVTNDGDKLVAGVSLNNNVALLFKNYSVHIMVVETSPFPIKPLVTGIGACGRNAVVSVNGTVYFISKDKRMKATDGYSVVDMSDAIDDIWDSLDDSRLEYIKGIYVPRLNQIHWYVTKKNETINNYCIIWDLTHKCWLINSTGSKVNCACLARGSRIFAGHYNGKIYEKDYAVSKKFNDDSDGIINAYWQTGWMSMDDPQSMKLIRYLDINFTTKDSGYIEYQYGYDYVLGTAANFTQQGRGGIWGTDTWNGTFIWGGNNEYQNRIFCYGKGNYIGLKIFNNNSNEEMEINGICLAMKDSGKKEFQT